MGQESSKVSPESSQNQTIQSNNSTVQQRFEEYDGIEVIDPLVIGNPGKERFYNKNIKIDCGELPDIHKMSYEYLRKIYWRINKNEEVITKQVRKQLAEYIELSGKLEKRQEDLNERLAKILALFRNLDEEVNNTTNSLKEAIEHADSIAAQIDPELIKFQDFKSQ